MIDNNQNEFNRWFSQAKHDFKVAQDNLDLKNYDWVCFQSQQSTEKALKAFLFLKGERGLITHSIFNLLNFCKKIEPDFSKLSKIKKLDQYYIAARYPNGLPDNIPYEYYLREDAEECLNYAGQTISLIENLTK